MTPELLKPRAGADDASGAMGSWLSSRAAAQRALQMALPCIEPLVADREVCGSGFLYIVVLDPARAPHECTFEDAVLIEHAIGDPSRWDADYRAFARAKARLSWRHGRDAHWVQTHRPHLLREGDTTLWGAVCLDGIVVGVSGAHPWYDEAFAHCVAGFLRAQAKVGAARAQEAHVLFAGR